MDFKLRLGTILREAAQKGDIGFNRLSVGVYDAPLSNDIDDIQEHNLNHKAWAEALSQGYIVPRVPQTEYGKLVLTPAAMELI